MAPKIENIHSNIPAHLDDELVSILHRRPGVRLERIVSQGQSSPPDFWYEQDEDEWVMVAEGAARLEFEHEGEVEMGPGDHVFLPAGCRHRVSWTDPSQDTIWIALFLSPPEHAT